MSSAVVTCLHAGRKAKKIKLKHQETTVQGTDTQRERGEGAAHGVRIEETAEKKHKHTARKHTTQSEQGAGPQIGATSAWGKKRSLGHAPQGSMPPGDVYT